MPRLPAATFESEKMRLRPPKLRDSWQIYRYLRDPLMRRFIRTPKVPRPWHGLAFVLRSTLGRWRGTRVDFVLVLKETGKVIGCRTYFNISLDPPRTAEYGIWIARPYWGNKLGNEASEDVVYFMYETVQIHRMYYRIHGKNLQALPKPNPDPPPKLKWSLEGTLRDHMRRGEEYHDMLIYSRLRTDPGTVAFLKEQRAKREGRAD